MANLLEEHARIRAFDIGNDPRNVGGVSAVPAQAGELWDVGHEARRYLALCATLSLLMPL